MDKLPRESVEIAGVEVVREPIDDIPGAVSRGVCALTGELKPPVRWADPWKDALHWMDSGDPTLRLNSLYKSLLGWAHITAN